MFQHQPAHEATTREALDARRTHKMQSMPIREGPRNKSEQQTIDRWFVMRVTRHYNDEEDEHKQPTAARTGQSGVIHRAYRSGVEPTTTARHTSQGEGNPVSLITGGEMGNQAMKTSQYAAFFSSSMPTILSRWSFLARCAMPRAFKRLVLDTPSWPVSCLVSLAASVHSVAPSRRGSVGWLNASWLERALLRGFWFDEVVRCAVQY
ncbi:uncharacterized protein IWZ02DRAFT_13743 [Phyllosticta citriasiana]|uniref:uncharacterized protein n=1 Tax=Phyllosticta citriasiana TaxID=595635 RepID=UPI0030FD7470